MEDVDQDEFVDRLRSVLQFLQDHGFTKAADAVYESLESLDKPLGTEDRTASLNSAPTYGQYEEDQPAQEEEYRSRSAEPVLVSSRGASEEAENGEEEPRQSPWLPGDAAALTKRLSGSTRLYEDPDVDEYDGMEDVGYIRRVVSHQQEFIMRQLDLLQDSDIEPYFHHSSGQQYGNNDSMLSGSASSSASLSSPGVSSCKQHRSAASLSHDNSEQQDQLLPSTCNSTPTGDAVWDSGPAGIVFAEPVTTPTKDSRRSSSSEPKPSLSRVESLSNSFIDELESCDGHGDMSGRLSEAGSIAGDAAAAAQLRASAAGLGSTSGAATASDYDDVIDLSPPSPPPDCAADAGIDLSNIFELGLRGTSRTSSVDVLYGSVRCWSETDSEFGSENRSRSQGAGVGSRSAPGVIPPPPPPAAAAAGGKQKTASKLQPQPEQQREQQQRQQQQQHDSMQQLQQEQQQPVQQPEQQQELIKAAEEPAEQQVQQSSPGGGSAAGLALPAISAGTSPAAASGGGAGGGGGFGFSFPTTPPSAVDAAVHEERAERVFSTWASNHSRSGLEAGGASDDEDTSSSKPFLVLPGCSPGEAVQEAAETDPNGTSWEFPMTPAAVPTALSAAGAAAAAVEADAAAAMPAAAAAAAAVSWESAAAGADSAAAGCVVLAAPVSPSTPFSPAAAVPGSSARDVSGGGAAEAASTSGGSRTHSTSLGGRAAAAGTSSASSSRHKASGSQGGTPPQGSAAAAAILFGTTGASPRSTLAEGRSSQAREAAGLEGLGYVDGLVPPAADADAASTGTGGFSGSGELAAPRYVVDEAGNLMYEYDATYVEGRYETFDLRVIHRRRRTGFEDSKEFPIRKNDLIAGRYQVMDFLGSAAFSQAVQALDTATGALVCLKIIKNNKDYFDQSLDEIKLLRYVNGADPDDEHHIVRLYDFFYYKEHLFLVCELLRANLYEFQKYQRENGDEPYFTAPRIQRIAIQVLQALAFLHSLGLVHSDLKPENILIKSYSRCEVKVIDLGSSCFITDHLSSYVQSRSYRAPEVILGLAYGQKIDLWSLGCILAELATGYVLFQNDSLATLLVRLEGILGPLPSWMISQGRYSSRYYTRSRQIYERNKATGRYELLLPKHTSLRHRVPGADEGFLDFLSYLLTPDPSARPSAEDALQHPWLSYPYPPVEQIPD